jgi:GNAT superfamily N-acetyltransferase
MERIEMIIEYPLTKGNRIRLARAFKCVHRVDMSIDCVLEGQMGQAFTDDLQEPTIFKIQVGPFFYCAGDSASPGGQAILGNIAPYTLFMPSSPGWIEAAKAMYGKRLVGFDRHSFSSEQVSVEDLDHLCQESALGDAVRQMDLSFVANLWRHDHFIDLSDFDSAEDFMQRGIGFYLEKHGRVAGAAYSSLVCSRGIEVSLFVLEEYRRQGIATVLSACLVKYCLENNAEANWDAANLESCRLAEKLGFVQTGTYQAYYLAEP